METFLSINDTINGFIWGPIMLCLLLGTGLYLSIRAGFIQFGHFRHMLKATFGSLFKGTGRDAEGNKEITESDIVIPMLSNGWKKIDDVWCYFDGTGYMLTGTWIIDGKTYHLRHPNYYYGVG